MALKTKFYLHLTIVACIFSCKGHFMRKNKVGQDYFTSVQSLTYLISVENDLLNCLESNKQLLAKVDSEFEDQLDSWLVDHMRAILNPREYVSHPISSFQLIKRLTVDWADLKEHVIDKAPANVTDLLERDIEPFLPTLNDLNGAVHGISFLCSVYTLPFDQVMNGVFIDRQYDVVLSVYDVLELVYVSIANGRAINAFLMMMEIIYQNDYPNTLLEDAGGLVRNLENALNKSGNAQMSKDLSSLMNRKLNNLTLPAKQKRQFQNDFIAKKKEALRKRRTKENNRANFTDEELFKKEAIIEDFKMFCAFCKYPNLSRSILNKNLSCRYKRDLPFLQLSPLKVEELNLDPPVLLFHEAISEGDIQFVKDAAIPSMQRAVVVNHDKAARADPDAAQNPSDSRISETAWLDEGVDERQDVVLARLDVRMNHMTSKHIMTSESLQVNNYGLGGYFAPHFDALHYNRAYLQPNNFDNREATIMFYMSDVEQGGSTVFLDLQLAVLPQKGTALYWHNLRPDRSVDTNTLHGACPVLVGNKWVCNKWIHRFDNHPYSTPQLSDSKES